MMGMGSLVPRKDWMSLVRRGVIVAEAITCTPRARWYCVLMASLRLMHGWRRRERQERGAAITYTLCALVLCFDVVFQTNSGGGVKTVR